MSALALIELPVGSISDAVERLDRKDDLGKVFEQQIVPFELHLDRVEHVHRVAFVAADECDEVAVAVENSPDAGAFADRGFAGTSGHSHRKQSAAKHRLFDLVNDLDVVVGPRQVEREREIGITKVAEVRGGFRLAFGISNLRQLADVAAGDG
jgi:hypothetical protein